MTTPLTIDDQFRRDTEIEANTPIAAGTWRFPDLENRRREPEAAMSALAKLVELKRRAMGMNILELSQKTGIPLDDLVALESGAPNRYALARLPDIARTLQLPGERLLELAGMKPGKPDFFAQAQQFVNRALPVKQLTTSEIQALDQFTNALTTE